MGVPPHKAKTRSEAVTRWTGSVLVVVLLGVLAVYMTLERRGAIVSPNLVASGQAGLPAAEEASKYTEGPEIPTGLQKPLALAMGPDGRLYVAGDRKLRIYLGARADKEYTLPAIPHCLAVARDGTIYVGFLDWVGVYDQSAHLLRKWEPLGLRSFLTALATYGDNIWVADAGNRVVLRYNRQGKILARLGERTPGGRMPALVVPSPYLGLAVGTDGMVFIANPGEHTVNMMTVEDGFRGAWGQAGDKPEDFAGCCNPTNLAVLPDGRVVTAEKGTPRVKVYSAQGELDTVVAGPEAFRPEAAGLSLATDQQGRIFVLDPTRRTVRVFQPNQESRK